MNVKNVFYTGPASLHLIPQFLVQKFFSEVYSSQKLSVLQKGAVL